MGLKVIGAGFGRTGAWSTYFPLKQLGFPCYHMADVIMNKASASHLTASDARKISAEWQWRFNCLSGAITCQKN